MRKTTRDKSCLAPFFLFFLFFFYAFLYGGAPSLLNMTSSVAPSETLPSKVFEWRIKPLPS